MAELVGNKENNKIYGNSKQSDSIYGLDGNDRIFSSENIDEDSGRDILVGDYGNYGINDNNYEKDFASDGNDILAAGNEINKSGGKIDDVAYGNGGNDALYGIISSKQNVNGKERWVDDTKRKGLFASFGNASGDRLYGGSGDDTYALGKGDVAWDRNPTGDKVFYIDGNGTERLLKDNWQTGTVNGKFIAQKSSPASLGSISEAIVTGEPTDKLIEYRAGGSGERSSLTIDKFAIPGVLKNESGDLIFRFPEGVAILTGKGDNQSVSFVRAHEDGKLLDSDFGVSLPKFSGFGGSTNSYVIGNAQWIKDLDAQVEKDYPGLGDSFAGDVQNWLRTTFYPSVDPLRKALVQGDKDYLTYDYVAFTGTEKGKIYGLAYNEKGEEDYSKYPGNPDLVSDISPDVTLASDEGDLSDSALGVGFWDTEVAAGEPVAMDASGNWTTGSDTLVGGVTGDSVIPTTVEESVFPAGITLSETQFPDISDNLGAGDFWNGENQDNSNDLIPFAVADNTNIG